MDENKSISTWDLFLQDGEIKLVPHKKEIRKAMKPMVKKYWGDKN